MPTRRRRWRRPTGKVCEKPRSSSKKSPGLFESGDAFEGMPRTHSNAGDGRPLRAPSENDWFRFQTDAETTVHALLDRLGERHHFGADRVAAVDQHQRLLLVHARAPDRLALPAARVDPPT